LLGSFADDSAQDAWVVGSSLRPYRSLILYPIRGGDPRAT
jgi:hypothetical protein